MLSHVEMAPAAAGFKLFGKVITQAMHGAGGADGVAGQASPVFVREKAEPEQPTSPRPHDPRKEPKLEGEDHEAQGGGGADTGSGGQSRASPPRRAQQEAAEARAAAAAPLPCPRCRSRDTKFCYFNNYNVNQPRHFCKACHRYWTAGGALRNVPVGAGRRKNRPLGPSATVPGHHRAAAGAAGFVLGFPNPSSPASPSPVYTDRWPVAPDRRF